MRSRCATDGPDRSSISTEGVTPRRHAEADVLDLLIARLEFSRRAVLSELAPRAGRTRPLSAWSEWQVVESSQGTVPLIYVNSCALASMSAPVPGSRYPCEESSRLVSGSFLWTGFNIRDSDVVDRLVHSWLPGGASSLRTSLPALLLTRSGPAVVGHIIRKLVLPCSPLGERVAVHAFHEIVEEYCFILGVDVLSEVLN